MLNEEESQLVSKKVEWSNPPGTISYLVIMSILTRYFPVLIDITTRSELLKLQSSRITGLGKPFLKEKQTTGNDKLEPSMWPTIMLLIYII